MKLLLAALALLLSRPVLADDAPIARVARLEGVLEVRGPFDRAPAEVGEDVLLREGDQLRAVGRAEVELPGAVFLRLERGTVALIERLAGEAQVRLLQGSAALSRGPDGPPASLRANDLELAPSAASSALVERASELALGQILAGRAEARCAGGGGDWAFAPDLVRCDQGRVVREAARPLEDFARFVLAREEEVRRRSAPAELEPGYAGLHELEGHGGWLRFEGAWYWRPSVLAAGWRPYADGYWLWCDPWGWTWVPAVRWGFVTHHYGRWRYLAGHGWVWSPRRGFAGAWVVWASFGGWLGWAPCDLAGRPVIVLSTHTHYDRRSWSFGAAGYFAEGGGAPRGAGRAQFTRVDDGELDPTAARPVLAPEELAPARVRRGFEGAEHAVVRERPGAALRDAVEERSAGRRSTWTRSEGPTSEAAHPAKGGWRRAQDEAVELDEQGGSERREAPALPAEIVRPERAAPPSAPLLAGPRRSSAEDGLEDARVLPERTRPAAGWLGRERGPEQAPAPQRPAALEGRSRPLPAKPSAPTSAPARAPAWGARPALPSAAPSAARLSAPPRSNSGSSKPAPEPKRGPKDGVKKP